MSKKISIGEVQERLTPIIGKLIFSIQFYYHDHVVEINFNGIDKRFDSIILEGVLVAHESGLVGKKIEKFVFNPTLGSAFHHYARRNNLPWEDYAFLSIQGSNEFSKGSIEVAFKSIGNTFLL